MLLAAGFEQVSEREVIPPHTRKHRQTVPWLPPRRLPQQKPLL